MCESVGCGLALMREGDSRKSKARTRTRIDELECTINVCVKERIPSRASFFSCLDHALYGRLRRTGRDKGRLMWGIYMYRRC